MANAKEKVSCNRRPSLNPLRRHTRSDALVSGKAWKIPCGPARSALVLGLKWFLSLRLRRCCRFGLPDGQLAVCGRSDKAVTRSSTHKRHESFASLIGEICPHTNPPMGRARRCVGQLRQRAAGRLSETSDLHPDTIVAAHCSQDVAVDRCIASRFTGIGSV